MGAIPMHHFPGLCRTVLAVASVLVLCVIASADEPPSIDEQVVIRDVLLLPSIGTSGRVFVPTNPITRAIVTGTFHPPGEGDVVPTGVGKQVVWTPATVPDDGPLRHELLYGGWVYAKVTSDSRRRAILRAKGHSSVYVNGVPRVANIYKYNYSMVPIVLEEGDNHFLFRCHRYGSFEARLEPISHDIMVNMEDATLPEAVRGEKRAYDAGIVVINTTTRPIDVARAQGAVDGDSVALPSYWMPPLSIAKLPVRLPARQAEGEKITYHLAGDRVQPAAIELAIVEPGLYRNVTFISDVEGSVQYFGYRPRRKPNDGSPPALMLHMHGAGDEAFAYRNLYYPKTWCAIASATNRRPFGFGWEAWGRIDAMEVLDHAKQLAKPDPSRIYLGGHSMGGHGVWLNAGYYPDRFAAIGVGAGWQDVWTYVGAQDYNNPTPVQKILKTASNPARTALLANNYKQLGVMMIHGDADNVVSINEAYAMRDLLESVGHDDWTMTIQPGGGHVYDTTPELGHSCFDSMQLFEFFQRHALPIAPQRVDFTTIIPGINDSCHWVRIEQQLQHMEPSRAQLQLDPGRRWLFGTLDNVRRFSVDPSILIEPGELTIQLDDEKERTIEWAGGDISFIRAGDGWRVAPKLDPAQKGPHRCGSVKTVLMGNHPVLVVGTNGTPEENAWALARARFDNDRMWYRGNSSFQVMLDTDFDPDAEPDRNVLLYGNADTNLAWNTLLGGSPIRVTSQHVSVGDRTFTGDDIACVMIRPRPGSDIAKVACIAGTGIIGMRTTDGISILTGGIYRPDFTVLTADCWTRSDAAILATGFFGYDWSLETGQVAIPE